MLCILPITTAFAMIVDYFYYYCAYLVTWEFTIFLSIHLIIVLREIESFFLLFIFVVILCILYNKYIVQKHLQRKNFFGLNLL